MFIKVTRISSPLMEVLNAASSEGTIEDKAETGQTQGSSESEFYYRTPDSRACYFALTLLSPMPLTGHKSS